jgi:hypothetical protein
MPEPATRSLTVLERSTASTAEALSVFALARRIEAGTEEANELEREIIGHVPALVPQLLSESGVGPIVAAQLIVSWSHRDRVRSEAAFARLAGVAEEADWRWCGGGLTEPSSCRAGRAAKTDARGPRSLQRRLEEHAARAAPLGRGRRGCVLC